MPHIFPFLFPARHAVACDQSPPAVRGRPRPYRLRAHSLPNSLNHLVPLQTCLLRSLLLCYDNVGNDGRNLLVDSSPFNTLHSILLALP